MKTAIYIAIAVAIIAIASCHKRREEFKSIGVTEFAEVIKNPQVQLLDVRTPQEHSEGAIPGSINIDVNNEDFKSEALSKLDKRRAVALYCRSGRRSKRAAEILTKEGYEVIELASGYNGWKESFATK